MSYKKSRTCANEITRKGREMLSTVFLRFVRFKLNVED